MSDLIIYEMHVRGFTQTADVEHPGTYLGLIEKIPYLTDLGINAVELMPVFEFDPTNNYWGYAPIDFFKPARHFAATDDPEREFRTMVDALHRANIEVLLDVVYNHTGETCPLSDDYYMMTGNGEHYNYSGCGNTLDCTAPHVSKLILDSLEYWMGMGVDGFRFDLASILTRGGDTLVWEISKLKTRLIAEAWDAAGLYQVGHFPSYGPWSEWNDRFRDRVRAFIKGSDGTAGGFATVMSGSEDLYGENGSPASSINFVTAHDGFTMRDLVGDHPFPDRQMQNFFTALLTAQGIPMIRMGDEYGHSANGNDNPYDQDNELNWFDWTQQNNSLHEFVKTLIRLRKECPLLRQENFLQVGEVAWHGHEPYHPDWSETSRFVAFSLQDEIYVAFNASDTEAVVNLPEGEWEDATDGQPAASPYLMPPHSTLIATRSHA